MNMITPRRLSALYVLMLSASMASAQQDPTRVRMTVSHPASVLERTDSHTATCQDGDYTITVKRQARTVHFRHDDRNASDADISQTNLGRLLLTRGAVGRFGYTCSGARSVNIAYTGFQAIHGAAPKPFRYFGSFAATGEAMDDPQPYDDPLPFVTSILVGNIKK